MGVPGCSGDQPSNLVLVQCGARPPALLGSKQVSRDSSHNRWVPRVSGREQSIFVSSGQDPARKRGWRRGACSLSGAQSLSGWCRSGGAPTGRGRVFPEQAALGAEVPGTFLPFLKKYSHHLIWGGEM